MMLCSLRQQEQQLSNKKKNHHHYQSTIAISNNKHFLTFLLLFLAPLLVSSLSSTSPSSSSSSSSPSSPPRSRRVFEFAPNGVCIQPKYFVLKGQEDNDDNKTTSTTRKFTMRNVPGDGDCMFLAVALAAATSMGLGGNDALLRAISRETREVVAQVLESPTGTLHITGKRIVSASDLLQSACQQEKLDKDAYLEALRKEGRFGGLYGGGPELTVLANVLRRPISIYELKPDHNNDDDDDDDDDDEMTISSCEIVCKGSFGKDLFEDPLATIPNSAVLSGVQPGAYSWELHILILDISPGEKHACVLLPETPVATTTTK